MEDQLYASIEVVIKEYEKKISYSTSGSLEDRLRHTLRELDKVATNTVWKTKNFLDDSKSQFKALIIVIEGLTDEGMNHGQKRVIANHVISMLRRFVDKIDNQDHLFSSDIYDRFDFYRTDTPEKRLREERHRLKEKSDNQEKLLDELKKRYPETFKEIEDQLPF